MFPQAARPWSLPGCRTASRPICWAASTPTSPAAAGSSWRSTADRPRRCVVPGAVRHHRGQGVVIETSGAGRAVGAGPENPISFVYHDHPITRGFDQRTIFGRAVPLDVAPTEVGEPRPLASTAETAFERVDLASRTTEFREGRDRRGPFALAVATSIPRGSRDAALPEPRIVVTGDSDFFANGLIAWTANRDLAVRMIAWLSGVEEARVVSVSERQNRRVPLTERRRTWMYLVNLGLLPLLPLAAGLLVLRAWSKRPA